MVQDDVGDKPVCAGATPWPEGSSQREQLLFEAINHARATGRTCDDEPRMSLLPLAAVGPLRCAARLHAKDLVLHDILDHEGTGGQTPFFRLVEAGYGGIGRHELLAADFLEVDEVLSAWLHSSGHCRALLNPAIDEVGVGRARSFQGDRVTWVVLTGESRP